MARCRGLPEEALICTVLSDYALGYKGGPKRGDIVEIVDVDVCTALSECSVQVRIVDPDVMQSQQFSYPEFSVSGGMYCEGEGWVMRQDQLHPMTPAAALALAGEAS